MWKAPGYLPRSTTKHPAMMRSRLRSRHRVMTRQPALCKGVGDARRWKRATTRLTAGFEYNGPVMNRRQAEMLLHG
jgi:hypothetical protein